MKSESGADRIVRALKEAGVRCVFGLPGTRLLELFEALRKSGLRTVTATNELGAAFMAGGWARVTGEPGVLITMAGPGFMWALNGVAEARLDSVPLLHITGAIGEAPIGRRFRQQELPQAAIATPLTKAVIDASSYSDPGIAIVDALRLACSPERGPVLVQLSSADLGREGSAPLRASKSADAGPAGDLTAVIARIRKSRRPLFIVGENANNCGKQLRSLVEKLGVPVLTTPSARGVLPETNPYHLGFDPFAERVEDVNDLIDSSDLVVAIGMKLGHSSTFGFQLTLPSDRLVHIDASADIVGANYLPSLEAVAEPAEFFKELLASHFPHSDWTRNELENWRARLKGRVPDTREPLVAGTPAGDARSFFRALRDALPADAVLVLDSGLHQILARRYYEVLTTHGLLMPTNLQSMGFSIPTAIGARLAMPERAVVALVGDGGFAMTALELLTAVRERVPLVVIVFVDGAFGQIRMQQLADYGASHAVSVENPNFMLLAAALGAHHESVGDRDIGVVMQEALRRSGVTVIEVPVGDTLKILGGAVAARIREGTKRVTGPSVFRRLRMWWKRFR